MRKLLPNGIWVQCRPHPSDSMPAAEFVRNRREGEPRSSRVADDSKNGNIGGKFNHEEPIVKLRLKFQQARLGARRRCGPARSSCCGGSASCLKGAVADLRPRGGGGGADLRASKERRPYTVHSQTPITYTTIQDLYSFFICSCYTIYI
jgi:hypothetical protein